MIETSLILVCSFVITKVREEPPSPFIGTFSVLDCHSRGGAVLRWEEWKLHGIDF
jgi:hypothetical protein